MGLLDKLLPRHKEHPEGQSFLVMVALSGAVKPTEDLLHSGLAALASPTSANGCSTRKDIVSCTILDSSDGPPVKIGTCILSLMRAPIPWSDLESACQRSWQWPEAAAVLRPHTHHWIIHVSARTEAAYIAAVTVRLTSALLSIPEVLGVYAGSAGLVHSPDFWKANVDSEEEASLADLWVNFGLEAPEEGLTSLRTQGLAAFGVMEIEIIRSERPYEEIYERTHELATYLIQSGPVLADGHTVGRSTEEKIIVKHEPSAYVPGETVYRIYV